MTFDAAASAGNATMDGIDLLGASLQAPMPALREQAVLVFPTAAADSPTEATLDVAPFAALFAGAVLEEPEASVAVTAGAAPVDDPETEVEEEDGETDEAPPAQATVELVRPETLRLIFPVHYFYTDVQMHESRTADTEEAPAEEPRPALQSVSAPSPRLERRAAEPVVPSAPQEAAPAEATQAGGEPRPASSEERPPEEAPDPPVAAPIERSVTPPATSPELPEPARPEGPARKAETEIAEIPLQPAAQPTPHGEARAPSEGIAMPEAERPPSSPRESRPKQEAAQSRPPKPLAPEPQAERPPRAEPDDARPREARPPAPNGLSVEPKAKELVSERPAFKARGEEKSHTPEAVEHAPRHALAETRVAAEPPARRTEANAPIQQTAKTWVEPPAPAAPARSVSIAIEGPEGEDVRAVVQSTGDGVQVRLQATDERTQQALQQGAPELRHRLEEAQRAAPGDTFEGLHRARETIADVQAPAADFGGQPDSGRRDAAYARDDSGGGQRHGERHGRGGGGRREREVVEEEFANYLEQGGK